MVVFTEQEAKELRENGTTMYKKTCHICGQEYWSSGRQQKYCSSECSSEALTKINKRNKTRRIRRKAYDQNKEINRALSKTYALAHEIADLYKIPKVCSECERDVEHKCKGPLQLHHKNLNPFDNSPGNLSWVCNSAHKSIHDKLGDVNIVEVYNKSLDEAGFEEDNEKYKVMIKYTEKIIEGARLNETKMEC